MWQIPLGTVNEEGPKTWIPKWGEISETPFYLPPTTYYIAPTQLINWLSMVRRLMAAQPLINPLNVHQIGKWLASTGKHQAATYFHHHVGPPAIHEPSEAIHSPSNAIN